MGERRLVVRTEVDCDNCATSGLWRDGSTCEMCDGHGWVESSAKPTPADLLTDPRVAALVDALKRATGHLLEPAYNQAMAALAPFEVRRG